MTTPDKQTTTEIGYFCPGDDFVEVETIDLESFKTISLRKIPRSLYFPRPPETPPPSSPPKPENIP